MITVELSSIEQELASWVGLQRQLQSLRAERRDRFANNKDNGYSIHIEGAQAELAVAKGLGIYWGGEINTFHAPDLDNRIQVRSTKRLDGHLIIRPDDNLEDIYFLVINRFPCFDLIGWITGREGMSQDLLVDKNNHYQPAYFVPRAVLWEIGSLRQGIYGLYAQQE